MPDHPTQTQAAARGEANTLFVSLELSKLIPDEPLRRRPSASRGRDPELPALRLTHPR